MVRLLPVVGGIGIRSSRAGCCGWASGGICFPGMCVPERRRCGVSERLWIFGSRAGMRGILGRPQFLKKQTPKEESVPAGRAGARQRAEKDETLSAGQIDSDAFVDHRQPVGGGCFMGVRVCCCRTWSRGRESPPQSSHWRMTWSTWGSCPQSRTGRRWWRA